MMIRSAHFFLTFPVALVLASVNAAQSADWPMFGRDATRNSVSLENDPPVDWRLGEFDSKTREWIRETAQNVRWVAPLGSQTIGDPVVADGLVWIGTNNHWGSAFDVKEDASVLACFRESDGKLLYRYVSPRLPQGRVNDWPSSSMACSPLVEGDRLWFVTNRCETVCLDIGPLKRGAGEPRVVWKLDMMKELGVYPKGSHMALTRFCSVASYKDRLYVNTGNGVDQSWVNIPSPEAPSLICVDKDDGTVLWQDRSPGGNILSGQWASPTVIEVDGKAQVVAPQGDGWVRSFDALSGELIWKFDINFKTSKWILGGRGLRNNILAPPVFYDGRIYVVSGQNAEHGDGKGRLCCIDPKKTGDISSELAVDADGKPLPHRRLQVVDTDNGERAIANPNSGLMWEFTEADEDGNGKIDFEEEFHRTLAGVAIRDDLLIAADFGGIVHCLDARTGKRHWHYDAFAAVYSPPLIVDDKVYVPDEDGDIAIFNLSPDPQKAMKEINGALHPINAALPNGDVETMPNSVYASPIFANGTLYVACRHLLVAIQNTVEDDGELGFWPQWRGPNRDNKSAETGLLQTWPDEGPPLAWLVRGIGQGIASLAVAEGRVLTLGYIGESEYLTALDAQSGARAWAARLGPAVEEHPLMRWLSQRTPTVDGDRLYAFTSRGEVICLAASDGKELWRKDYVKDFGATAHSWGLCDYPLVDGDRLVCTPGGSAATMVALNKLTGEVLWKSDVFGRADWSAPVVSEAGGVRQYVTFVRSALVGVAADGGELLWKYDKVDRGYNAQTPIVHGEFVFASNGRLGDAILLQLVAADGGVAAGEVYYENSSIDAFADATVLLDDHLYAMGSGGVPLCLKWNTGQRVWFKRPSGAAGRAAWTYAHGHLYQLHANGRMALVAATSKEYVEQGAFDVPGYEPARGATMPVVAGGRLFVRNDDRLFCYDVRDNALENGRPEPREIVLKTPDARASGEQQRTQRSAFVPTPHDIVEKMLEAAEVKKTDVVFDLGSGDGRIVITAAKNFECKAVGYEIDRELVELSRERIRQAGVEQRATIEQGDLFDADLSSANVVAVYLLPKQLERLVPQFERLAPGSRIVSHQFEIPGFKPDKSIEATSTEDGDTHPIHMWTTPLVRSK